MVVKQSLSALLAGLLFGWGLALSRMIDPSVVIGFLDVTGEWDPRLLFVMGGALLITFIGFPLIKQRYTRPLCDDQFHEPLQQQVDRRLLGGAVLFGVGWGLGGVCPGPAVTALAMGVIPAVVFFIAMLAGMVLFEYVAKKQ